MKLLTELLQIKESKAPSSADRELYKKLKAEEDRLFKMTTKQIEQETGLKASHKHLSKEILIQNALTKKFGQSAYDRFTLVDEYDFNHPIKEAIGEHPLGGRIVWGLIVDDEKMTAEDALDAIELFTSEKMLVDRVLELLEAIVEDFKDIPNDVSSWNELKKLLETDKKFAAGKGRFFAQKIHLRKI